MNEIFIRLQNAGIRTEKTIFLAGALAQEVIPDDLESFFEEEERTIVNCLGEIPEEVDLDDSFDLSEWLSSDGKLGFLMQFAKQIKDEDDYGTWGYYSTKWFYGDTLEEVVNKGIEWST